MAESFDQGSSKIIPQSSNVDSEILSPEESNLVAINENLTERIKLAKTPDEIREYLKLKEYIANQQIKQETAKLRVEQTKNQINFSRRLTIAREARTIVASVITVSIGLYLVASSPVFGALLIILGLAKPLEYSLGEISYLLNSLAELTRQLPELFYNNREKLPPFNETSGNRSNENKA